MLVDVVAKSGEAAKSGPIGLAVILILCIGCYFLFKSMSKHMRKVREEFPGKQASDDASSADVPASDEVHQAGQPAETPAAQPTSERPAE
jgi:hypothetical protein